MSETTVLCVGSDESDGGPGRVRRRGGDAGRPDRRRHRAVLRRRHRRPWRSRRDVRGPDPRTRRRAQRRTRGRD